MISRRHIRLKVMQSLYAFFLKKEDNFMDIFDLIYGSIEFPNEIEEISEEEDINLY